MTALPAPSTTPSASRNADRGDAVGAAAADDQRIAALVEQLADRDERHLSEAASRRPVLWLIAMTASAVALAQLAVTIAVAPI